MGTGQVRLIKLEKQPYNIKGRSFNRGGHWTRNISARVTNGDISFAFRSVITARAELHIMGRCRGRL
jgi:hypothetical protein